MKATALTSRTNWTNIDIVFFQVVFFFRLFVSFFPSPLCIFVSDFLRLFFSALLFLFSPSRSSAPSPACAGSLAGPTTSAKTLSKNWLPQRLRDSLRDLHCSVFSFSRLFYTNFTFSFIS